MWSLLRLLFWVLVFVLALSFFGISLREIVNSPAGQANFSYLIDLAHQFVAWLKAWRPA